MSTIDTGDAVKHGPTGETWLVAYVDGDRLCPCGWPCCLAEVSDCTLVEKATPQQRMTLLRELAAMGPDERGHPDPRASRARAVLAAMAPLAATDCPATPPEGANPEGPQG